MKKIAVVGLYSIKNVGDTILCEATQFLINENIEDCEIIELDVNPTYKNYITDSKKKLNFYLWKGMNKYAKTAFSYKNKKKFRYNFEYLMWSIKMNKIFIEKLKDVDAIIFAGGGFIKFRTQGLNYYVEQIIKIAEKNCIPVMFNGVGIEGYDDTDIRCNKLKVALNSKCVKIITTRDDIVTLEENYVTEHHILTKRVADPAFWIRECYRVDMHEKNKILGINLIRGKIFTDYGNNLNEFKLLIFYQKLIFEVKKRGIDFVLFSNGMKADVAFGNQLISSLKLDKKIYKIKNFKNTEKYVDFVDGLGCVFGARLHACITAKSLNTPVVGLIWNEKLDYFAQIYKLSDSFFNEDNLNVEKIVDVIEIKLSEQSNMRENYETQKDLRKDTEFMLKSFLDSI